MGSAFLCGQAGIAERTLDNSAAYVESWLARLKVAMSLTPEQAIAIAGELLTAATRKSSIQASAGKQQSTKPKTPTQTPK